MDTISNETCTQCQHCGEWTNHADAPHYKALLAERERQAARIAELEAEVARLNEWGSLELTDSEFADYSASPLGMVSWVRERLDELDATTKLLNIYKGAITPCDGEGDLDDQVANLRVELYTTTQITALQRENEELRKDAERYRWLRHGDNDEQMLQFSLESKCGRDDAWLMRLDALDAAIDAAMKGRAS